MKIFATLLIIVILISGCNSIQNNYESNLTVEKANLLKKELINKIFVSAKLENLIRLGITNTTYTFKKLNLENDKINNYFYSNFSKNFDIEKLKNNIKERLLQNLTLSNLSTIQSWYSSDLGKKILAYELRDEDYLEFKNTSIEKPTKELIEERLGIFLYLAELKGVVENAFKNLEIYKDIFKPYNIKALNNLQIKTIEKDMKFKIVKSYIHIYHGISNKELLKYVNFNSLDGTKKFNEILIQEMNKEGARAVMKIVKNLKSTDK